jgi:hypothetical protein
LARPAALRAAPRRAIRRTDRQAAAALRAQQLAVRLAALPRAQPEPAWRLSAPLRAEQVRREPPAPRVGQLPARAARLRLSVLRSRVSRSRSRG